MKEKLTHNMGYKLLSLFIAVIIWFIVISVEDPVYTRQFTDIPVQEVNGDAITEAGVAYRYVSGNTVSVRVTGRTSILNRLTNDDFLAIADMRNLSITDAVMVDVTCPKYPSLDIQSIGSSTVLRIEKEALKEKSLNIKVQTVGKAGSDHYVAQGIATPNMITISGPESEIDRVEEAVVNVTVSAANRSDITTNTDVILMDKNGHEVNSSTIITSQSKIDICIPIYETKVVPVQFGVTGELDSELQLVSAVFEPKQVTIAGRAEALEKVDKIVLKDYDLTGRKEAFEDSISIQNYLAEELPEGVVFTDKEANIALVVDIQKTVRSTYEFPVSKIALKGSNLAYVYTKESLANSDHITLHIEGTEKVVNDLRTDQISAVVDVTDLDSGTYNLPVEVTFDDDLTLLDASSIHMVIKQTGN